MGVEIKPFENLPRNPMESRRDYRITGDEIERMEQMGTMVRLSEAVEYSVKIFKSIAEDQYRERERDR